MMTDNNNNNSNNNNKKNKKSKNEKEKEEEENDLTRSRDAARESAASFVDVIRILNDRICDVQTQILSLEERVSKLEAIEADEEKTRNR